MANENLLAVAPPDFSVLDDSGDEGATADQGAESGGTEQPEPTISEEVPAEEPIIDSEDSDAQADPATTQPEAAQGPVDEWGKIREEFPELTHSELVRMRDTRENLEKHYNRRFEELAGQKNETEQLRGKWQEAHDILSTQTGKHAIELARFMQDPRNRAAMEKAYQEVQPDPGDVSRMYTDQRVEAMERKYESLRAEQERGQKAAMDQTVREYDEAIQRKAKEIGQAEHQLFAEVNKRCNATRANGQVLNDFELNKILEDSAEFMTAEEERRFQVRLTGWKKGKTETRNSAPPGRRGTAAPARSAPKKPNYDDPDWALKVSKSLWDD